MAMVTAPQAGSLGMFVAAGVALLAFQTPAETLAVDDPVNGRGRAPHGRRDRRAGAALVTRSGPIRGQEGGWPCRP